MSGLRLAPTPHAALRRAPVAAPRRLCVCRTAAGGTQRDSWVTKILRVRSLWSLAEKPKAGDRRPASSGGGDRCTLCEAPDARRSDEEASTTMEFDQHSFSRFLQRVSFAETKNFAKMAFLGTLAYNLPKIKPAALLKFYSLRFVTSSLEKKTRPVSVDTEENEEGNSFKKARAAAYKGILQFNHRGEAGIGISNSDMASFMAAADSVTAVVAAEETVKQAVADDLSSATSPPCEWFICDDDRQGTRYFAIQGSVSIASWKANLLFEPVQFEGYNVLVHRGVYEAAKGIYKQILPEVHAHLKSWGSSATFRFTGHSLGGSLSILVNLMLFIRGEVPLSSLLPVVTFGAPCILCGGDTLLRILGLPQNHVQSIIMHRDIVPRAFSCNYPNHIARILKALNGKFRHHPCLVKEKFLYAPMGKLLILQPEEKYSPFHHLLPSGSGLYILGRHSPRERDASLLQAAQSTFLNSPHPLEVLSERAAYTSRGTVSRNHRVRAYLRSLYGVARHELAAIKKINYENERWLWPSFTDSSFGAGVTVGWQLRDVDARQLDFSDVVRGGKKTLKGLGTLVASGHVSVLFMLLFPARSLLAGMLTFAPWS